MAATATAAATWKQYNEIKKLVIEFGLVLDEESLEYEKFIHRLVEILGL